MTGQIQVFSQDRKLYVGMSIASIKSDNTKTNQEKLKLIELFNKTNTTQDTILDLDEIRAYDSNLVKDSSENQTPLWKKVAIGAGIAVGTLVLGYLAYKGIKYFKNVKSTNVVKQNAEKIISESNPIKSKVSPFERRSLESLGLNKTEAYGNQRLSIPKESEIALGKPLSWNPVKRAKILSHTSDISSGHTLETTELLLEGHNKPMTFLGNITADELKKNGLGFRDVIPHNQKFRKDW